MKHWLFEILLIMGVIGPGGCFMFESVGSMEGDISHVARVWGGYDSKVYYQLQKPVYLWRIVDENSDRILAIPPDPVEEPPEGFQLPMDIPTFEQYGRSPQQWPDILAVAPVGTQLQCTIIYKHGVWPHESHLIYYADIRGGEYDGLEIVINALSAVFNCDCTPVTLKPNPELLRVSETMGGGRLD